MRRAKRLMGGGEFKMSASENEMEVRILSTITAFIQPIQILLVPDIRIFFQAVRCNKNRIDSALCFFKFTPFWRIVIVLNI